MMLRLLVLVGLVACVFAAVAPPLHGLRFGSAGQPEVAVTGNNGNINKRQIRPVATGGAGVQVPVGVIRPAQPQQVRAPKRPLVAPARPNSARPNGGGFAPVQTAPSGSGSNVGTGSRPLRQSAASPSRPEFDEGFPEGFTRGLPTFDFQGRMPEPDSISEGFMGDAQANFPSLKTFGGFDRMPEATQLAIGGQEPRASGNKPLIRLPAPTNLKSGFRS